MVNDGEREMVIFIYIFIQGYVYDVCRKFMLYFVCKEKKKFLFEYIFEFGGSIYLKWRLIKI